MGWGRAETGTRPVVLPAEWGGQNQGVCVALTGFLGVEKRMEESFSRCLDCPHWRTGRELEVAFTLFFPAAGDGKSDATIQFARSNATASVVREERHARARAASRHPQPPPLARHAGRSRRGRIPLLLDPGAGGAGGEDEEAGRWGRWSAPGRGGRRGRGGGARRAGEADRFPPIRRRRESSARRREVETRRLGAVRSAGSTAPASGSTARRRGGGGARRLDGPCFGLEAAPPDLVPGRRRREKRRGRMRRWISASALCRELRRGWQGRVGRGRRRLGALLRRWGGGRKGRERRGGRGVGGEGERVDGGRGRREGV
jgi:hypothetical protein